MGITLRFERRMTLRTQRRPVLPGVAILLLTIFFVGCFDQTTDAKSSATDEDGSAIRNALRADPEDGFAKATAIPQLEFPRDHQAHPDYRTEWWYLTGNVVGTETKNRYGFQVTWFRQGLTHQPHEAVAALSSVQDEDGDVGPWTSHVAWMAHIGLSDPQQKRFHQAHQLSRGGIAGAAGCERGDDVTTVFLDRWQLEIFDDDQITISVDTADSVLRLYGDNTHGTVLRGDQGLSQKSASVGNASIYYAWPRIEVSGVVSVDGGETFEEVRGLAWFDREWGSTLLDDEQSGWDWFALHFDSGHDLMVYSLRRKDGQIDPFARAHMTSGPGQSTDRRWSPEEWSLTTLETWRSPHTGTTWPIAWRLSLQGEEPIEVRAVMPDQEHHGDFSYWEGAVDVLRGGNVIGTGYVELTGYGQE